MKGTNSNINSNISSSLSASKVATQGVHQPSVVPLSIFSLVSNLLPGPPNPHIVPLRFSRLVGGAE